MLHSMAEPSLNPGGPPSWRRRLAPLPLLKASGGKLLGRRSRRSPRPVGLVLVHHEIAPRHGDPARDLVPPLGVDLFRRQLEYIGAHYDVVPLRELPARARDRSPRQRLPVAITFDDDLSAHLSIAAPILEQFGFTATFFLTGSCLREPSSFWWQDLQAIRDQGPDAWADLHRELAKDWPWARLDGRADDLLLTIEGLPPNQRDDLAARLRELAGGPPADAGLSAEAVESLVRRGFEIGFHTLRHYSLRTLDAKGLDRAMEEGLDELQDVVGYQPTAIAYPHGNADLRIAEAAQRGGFEQGFIGTHAATRPDQHPLLMARIVAWTDSLDSFAWALGRLSMAT